MRPATAIVALLFIFALVLTAVELAVGGVWERAQYHLRVSKADLAAVAGGDGSGGLAHVAARNEEAARLLAAARDEVKELVAQGKTTFAELAAALKELQASTAGQPAAPSPPPPSPPPSPQTQAFALPPITRRNGIGSRMLGCPIDYTHEKLPDWVIHAASPQVADRVRSLMQNGFESLVVIAIVTSPTSLDRRGSYLNQTWAGPYIGKSVFFVSDHQASYPGSVKVDCETTQKGMGCKTSAALKFLWSRFPNTKFFIRATDDTYIHVPNLLRYLIWMEPEKDLYLTIGMRLVIDNAAIGP
jgi:hypothetical protein